MTDDLAENYKQAYSNRVGFGKNPALVLVDFAHAYFDKDCDLYAGVEDALASALRVREAAHAAGVPVILTEVSYQPGGINGGRFFEKAKPLKAFVKGERTAAFADGLIPRADEIVVTKTTDSALTGTNLRLILHNLGIRTVICAGIFTDQCVASTVRSLADESFDVVVVEDACAAATIDLHEAELRIINMIYCNVMNCDELQSLLSR